MTEWSRLCCDLVVTQAILKAIGISVHVSSDEGDARLEVIVHGVPHEFRDRVARAINEVIDTALHLSRDPARRGPNQTRHEREPQA